MILLGNDTQFAQQPRRCVSCAGVPTGSGLLQKGNSRMSDFNDPKSDSQDFCRFLYTVEFARLIWPTLIV